MTYNKNNEIYNASACIDTTAYEAIKNVRKQERRELVQKLKEVANQNGYNIVSTIRLQEMEDGNNE